MAKLIKANGEVEDINIPKDNSLSFLQDKVGGYIELAPYLGTEGFAGVCCDEEGKMKGYPINATATKMAGYTNDVLVGDVIMFNEGEID